MQRASEGGAIQASGSASCHGVSEVELEPEDETDFENQINDTAVEMSPLFLQGFLQAVVQAMLRDARNRIEPRVDIEDIGTPQALPGIPFNSFSRAVPPVLVEVPREYGTEGWRGQVGD